MVKFYQTTWAIRSAIDMKVVDSGEVCIATLDNQPPETLLLQWVREKSKYDDRIQPLAEIDQPEEVDLGEVSVEDLLLGFLEGVDDDDETQEQLDDAIHTHFETMYCDSGADESELDAYSQQASDLNNEGMEEQCRWLLGNDGLEDIERIFEGKMGDGDRAAEIRENPQALADEIIAEVDTHDPWDGCYFLVAEYWEHCFVGSKPTAISWCALVSEGDEYVLSVVGFSGKERLHPDEAADVKESLKDNSEMVEHPDDHGVEKYYYADLPEPWKTISASTRTK